MAEIDQVAECHRLMNEAGIPGNQGTGNGIVGRVQYILSQLATANRMLDSDSARLYTLENENERLNAEVEHLRRS